MNLYIIYCEGSSDAFWKSLAPVLPPQFPARSGHQVFRMGQCPFEAGVQYFIRLAGNALDELIPEALSSSEKWRVTAPQISVSIQSPEFSDTARQVPLIQKDLKT
jgi:hypothetical protein